MTEFPDDVLIVDYKRLSLDPANRICIICAIGTLIDRPSGFYTPTALALSSESWLCLRSWLKQGNGSVFWQLERQGVYVIRKCEKHVLIGTGQLLSDLREMIHISPMSQSHSFEAIWMAARHYVVEHVARTVR